MSRQQSRPSGDGAIDPSLVQKKRARHRLVGAICLCILAAIIVPLVLESEPRPRDHELPIELAVPARGGNPTAPDAAVDAATQAPGTPAATAPLASAGDAARPGGAVASGQIGKPGGHDRGASAAAPAAGDATADSRSAVKTVTPPAPGEVPKVEPPRSESASQAARQEAARQAAAKQEAARQEPPKAAEAAKQEAVKAAEAAKTADAAKAAKAAEAKAAPAKPPAAPEKPATRKDEPDVLARLIERADDGAGSGAAAGKAVSRRFLVQIGAYSNVQSAKTASDRAVQLGLRPFQETVKTAQGDWIRVRVGPFTNRQDAERAQEDLKRAGVTAAIIAL